MTVSERRQAPRSTKIVATIGPATWTAETLAPILRAGVDIVRVNAAHSSIDERRRIVKTIRDTAKALERRTGILQDLGGPKPRTGPYPDGKAVELTRGEAISLVAGDDELAPARITIDDAPLVAGLEAGQRVLIADGLIELRVTRREGATVLAQVVRGGAVRGRQGVTVPGAKLPPRRLSAQEQADIAFAADADLEYLGVSFVTSAEDIQMVRQELESRGGRAKIVAKIERPEALAAVEAIAREADALMVARGDLGVQIPPEQVPIAQRHIIQVARGLGTPVITATQMLESMIYQPIPTRAEANDVATAVTESSDAVMLSAETATGGYPVEAVEMMDNICRAVEGHFPIDPLPEAEARPDTVAEATARAASHLAHTAGARLIAVFTRSGYTARQIARERPPVPIVALTGNEYVANQLALVWGVQPLLDAFEGDTEALIARLCRRLIEDGYASSGERAVFVGSLEHHHDAGHTDLLHLREL